MNKEEKQQLVDSVPFWWHSIDLGDGVITPGQKPLEFIQEEIDYLRLPDLTNKSVLDIGAWDGAFSFEAERRGASRVMALDHYAWSVDIAKQHTHIADCQRAGRTQTAHHLRPEIWQPGTLPGRRGFEVAHQILHSFVECTVGDFMTIDPMQVAQFDISLFLGVLYHISEPLTALRRLRFWTKELAIIETQAVYIPELEGTPIFQFFNASDLANDPTNWWTPNLAGLTAMCQAAGFRDVYQTGGTYPPPSPQPGANRALLTVHAAV
jgi:tRNA (mo5U34)-methyltransferase